MSESLSESKLALPLSAADREAVAEIVADVSHSSKQGCLHFAVCNNRLKIESVEAALKEGLGLQGFEIKRLVLAEREPDAAPPSYRVLIPDPIGYFASSGAAPSTLFLVHGLPELVRAEMAADGSGPAPVSQRLNYRREVFHHKAVCALFWIDTETMRYLMNWSRDFWSFRSGTAQFPDTGGEADLRLNEGSGWQTMAPSTRWLGDVQEKLEQLALYRQKSPPDEAAIAVCCSISGAFASRGANSSRLLKCSTKQKRFSSVWATGVTPGMLRRGSREPTKPPAACEGPRNTSGVPSR